MKIMCALPTILLAWATTAQAQESPKALQDAFLAALRGHDADGLAACYAKDAVNFPVDELVGLGPDSVRASWSGFFEDFQVMEVSLSEDHLETHGDVAFAWGLFEMTVEPIGGGEAQTMTGRYLDVARNFDGQWLYVADHASVPITSGEPEDP